MASPYSTGGGGTHFEAKVAAYFLAGVLAEAPVRALPGIYATSVATQRSAFGEPLDDIVIYGVTAEGDSTKLSIQVKSTLSFTENDTEWVSSLEQAWDTFQCAEFDGNLHRFGVAIGTYHAKTDKYYQSVITWAKHSATSSDFFKRISEKDFSHRSQREFVEAIKVIVSAHAKSSPTNDDLWEFIKVLRILHFDFHNEDATRDGEIATQLIRSTMPVDSRGAALQIWDRLVVCAGEAATAGGSIDRASLQARILEAGLPVAPSSNFRVDISKLDRESHRGLQSVKPDLQGLRLKRSASYEKIQDAIFEGRFIQIIGEPGSGKSALLRQLAEEAAVSSPILFLKDLRIQPRGWAAHATTIGVSEDLVELLQEFAFAGAPLLFIDGLDKISDPTVQLTINDVLQTIVSNDALEDWKVVATVREQNLEHIATWIDPDSLNLLTLKSVTVPPLDAEEMSVVANRFPRLTPLLNEARHADKILQRPFFLDAILRLSPDTSTLPASEAELLRLWWSLGGTESQSFSSAQEQRNALLNLAGELISNLGDAIAIRNASPTAINQLREAGVLRDVRLGHSVTFTHDIYEEWSLAQWLVGQLPDVRSALMDAGEPDELVRPLQLVGSDLLEFEADQIEWRLLFESVDDTTVRPVWQRSLLTSCLRSTRSAEILPKLATYLSEDDHSVFRKLINALQTLEVVPDARFMDAKTFPDIEPEERAKYSQIYALPKGYIWIRFLNWLMQDDAAPAPELIGELVPAFSTWQSAFGGYQIKQSRWIGELSYRWLLEFEDAYYTDSWANKRKPFGVDFPGKRERDLAKEIRSLFLSSSGDVPTLVKKYLSAKGDHPRHHIFRDDIMASSNTVARFLPAELVDYVMKTHFKHPRDDKSGFRSGGFESRDLGLNARNFYPSSPMQAPFAVLLRDHPEEGLRLVHEVCNFSIEVWRWLHETGHRKQKLTPIPVEIDFPWGTQAFWGDGAIYTWFRGAHGNDAVSSALMALESWAFLQIEAGSKVADVIERTVRGNNSVAALGLGVSIATAHIKEGIEPLLPFIKCAQIWHWDIARAVSDQMGSHANEIADWSRNRHLMQPVRDLNQKAHRRTSIRDYVPYFVFSGDEKLKEDYSLAVRSFANDLPYEFEEEKADQLYSDELTRTFQRYSEQGDPKYWHQEKTDDGQIKLWNSPPSENDPEATRAQEDFALLNRYLRISLWAQKLVDGDAPSEEISPSDAIAAGREFDCPKLFQNESDDFNESIRRGAVAGAAYAFVMLADDEEWNAANASWTAETLRRTAQYQDTSSFTFRESVLPMHPLIFAAHGITHLLSRNYEPNRTRREVFELALHPLAAVSGAVVKTSRDMVQSNPTFGWELFVLMLNSCICNEVDGRSSYSLKKSDEEKEFHSKLIENAERALNSGGRNTLPDLPSPWVKIEDGTSSDGSDDYQRNPTRFLSSLAEKTILEYDFSSLLGRPENRAELLNFLNQLVTVTFDDIVPPFANSRRGYGGNIPFEWIHRVFTWLGKIAGSLTPDEVDQVVLQPIAATDQESGLMAMSHFVRGFAAHNILPPADPAKDAIEIWQRIAHWVLNCPTGSVTDYLEDDLRSCASALLFCFHGDFQPLVCFAEKDWSHLTDFTDIFDQVARKFGTNETMCFVVTKFLQKGGIEFSPTPAVEWLDQIARTNRANQVFWSKNGEEFVSTLKLIYAEKDALLTEEHRANITFIIDVLVDNGVRGAGFLQQEQHRPAN